MRVLLGECVPIQLKREFAEFDAVLTVDVGMDVSLARSGARIGVVLIRAHRTNPKALVPYLDAARAALRSIKPGQFVAVGG